MLRTTRTLSQQNFNWRTRTNKIISALSTYLSVARGEATIYTSKRWWRRRPQTARTVRFIILNAPQRTLSSTSHTWAHECVCDSVAQATTASQQNNQTSTVHCNPNDEFSVSWCLLRAEHEGFVIVN